MRILKIITVIFILLFSILYLFYYSNKNIIGNTEGAPQIIKNFIPQPIKNILKSTLFKDAWKAALQKMRPTSQSTSLTLGRDSDNTVNALPGQVEVYNKQVFDSVNNL